MDSLDKLALVSIIMHILTHSFTVSFCIQSDEMKTQNTLKEISQQGDHGFSTFQKF